VKTVRPVGLLSLLSLKMKPTGRVCIAVVLSSLASQLLLAAPIVKPLRVHPTNPRYFTDDGVRAILLTGSHTWNNLVDMGPSDPPPRFDYDAYLFCLANPSREYLVYQPKGGEVFSVELSAGTYRYEWFDPLKGDGMGKGSIQAGRGVREFKNPFAGDAALYLKEEP